MPVSLTPTASTRPPSSSLRFGSGAPVKEIFPPVFLPLVRYANEFQKSVIDLQKGDELELENIQNGWHLYDAHMEQLQEAFKNKTTYEQNVQDKLALLEKRHQLVLQKYPQVVDQAFDAVEDDSVQIGSASKTRSGKAKAKASTSEGDGASSKDAKFRQAAAANWTSRDERTRWRVLMDLGKQYITRGPLLSDSLWSLGIGAVLAIGSPVMTVTIPTTFAFFLAGRAVLGLIHACQDPQGNSINDKYQKWIEKDAEKLKKQEARQTSG